MSQDSDTQNELPRAAADQSSEQPARAGCVVYVSDEVWRATRLEQIAQSVRTGAYRVNVERLADALLGTFEGLRRRRR